MKVRLYLGVILLFSVMMSCKQDNEFFYEDIARLQFGPPAKWIYWPDRTMTDTLIAYTFVYKNPTVLEDTMYFDIHTMGGPTKTDRRFRLKQLHMEGEENAVPGVHYRAFDSKEAAPFYVIHKDSVHERVPIILLRDPSLKNQSVRLRFQIEANENFQPGETRLIWREVQFTDRYAKPTKWSETYYGVWGEVKMDFMVRVSGGLRWDNDCLLEMSNSGGMFFWPLKFNKVLMEENLAAVAAGKEKLKEKDGRFVAFP